MPWEAIIFGWLVVCFIVIFAIVIMSHDAGGDLLRYLKEHNYNDDLQRLGYGQLTRDSFKSHSYLFEETNFHDDEKLLELKIRAKRWRCNFYIAFLVFSCSLLVVLVGGLLYSFIKGG